MTTAITSYELDPACQQTMMKWATTLSVEPTVPALNLVPVDILNTTGHYAEMRPSERLASAVADVEGENHTFNCSALRRCSCSVKQTENSVRCQFRETPYHFTTTF